MKNTANILVFFLLSLVFSANTLLAENVEDYVKKGNAYYKNNKFKEAEVQYRKALEANPNSNIAKYNLGTSYYRQGNFDEALKSFDAVEPNHFDKKNLANAYYNLGNSYLESKKYQESIDSYKKALINNPKDYDTKYNLEYARKMLQQQMQQQNQQNKQDQQNKGQNKQNQQNQQNKDQNKQNQQNQQNKDQNKQNQQNQQNKDQNKQNQQNQQNKDQNKQNQQNQQNKDQNQQNQQQQQQDKQKISKQDAERILQALTNEEKNVQKKLKAKAAVKGKLEKNW